MSECLEVVMSNLDEQCRNALMVRKLAEIRKIEVGREYKQMRNTMFENTKTSMCPICNRMIGDSVFMWTSSGIVMHAACADTDF